MSRDDVFMPVGASLGIAANSPKVCHSERSEVPSEATSSSMGTSATLPSRAPRHGSFASLRMTNRSGNAPLLATQGALSREQARSHTRCNWQRTLILLCLLCLLWPFLPACSRREAAAPAGVLRVSQRNEPATLDPHLATLPDEFFVIRALGEGLLNPAPDGGPPQPGVAASWTVSADGRTYLFNLRSDARWSNGDPVTAADFVYSIRRALSPALAAPKANLFYPLKLAAAFHAGRESDFAVVGARALDAHRLELVLEAPLADFPALVASGPWIPVQAATVERNGGGDRRDSPWTQPGRHVGNGPFTLASWQPNQQIVVRRNPRYWNARRVRLEEIRFLAFDNGDSEERAFRAGQLDVTMSVPVTKLAAYRAAAPSPLRTVPQHETRYLALNTTRPPLDDPRVRRALGLALNRRDLVEKVLLGGQAPAFTYLPPGLGGYAPAARLTEDAGAARELLRAAGFPDGRGFPRLELSTWYNPPVLEAIQQMWRRELGIEVALVRREARTHLAALAAGDFALALVPAIPDYNSAADLLDELCGDRPGNYSRWRNAEFDRLVAASEHLAAADARLAASQAAEQLLLAAMPVVPLYFNNQNILVGPRVTGWRTDPLWSRFYLDLSAE